MSVNTNHYIIIGKKFECDEFKNLFKSEEERDVFVDKYGDSAFNDTLKNDEGLTLLYDGMNGEYAILGVALAKTDVEQGFHKVYDVNYSTIDKSVALHHLNQALKGLYEVSYNEVRPYVLTHHR